MKKSIKYIFITLFLLIAGFFIFNNNVYANSDTEITFGSEYIFNMASTSAVSLDDLSSSKLIVAYRDGGGNFNQGTVIIANISDNTITFGSEYVFNDASTDYVSVKMLSENKAVIVYKDEGNSNYGAVVIADISGNEISFGSEYVFNTALTEHVSVTVLSESKFMVVYQDSESGFKQGKVIIGEVNGNVVSFGLEYVFNEASIDYVSVKMLSENKAVIVYKDEGNSNYGAVVIADISGNEISFGSEYVFNPTATNYISMSVLSENKIAIAYQDYGGNQYGRAIIADISGTEISFGSEYVFNPTATNYISIDVLSESKFVIAYQDYGDNQYGRTIIGSISDNTISFGSEYVFNTAITGITFTQSISQSKFVIGYQDKASNLNYGTAVIGSIPEEEVPEPEPQPTPEAPAGEAEPEPLPAEAPSGAEEGEPELLNDGDLIRNPNAAGAAQFDVYIIKLVGSKKFKRLILSPHVFESYEHLKWDNIKDISQTTMDVYTTSALVRAEEDFKVYKLTPDGDTGLKQWLNMTAAEFEAAEYEADSIYTINTTDRDAYTIGEDIND